MSMLLLPSYAQFLIDTYLEEVNIAVIAEARRVHLPLMKLFEGYSEEQLNSISKQELLKFLQDIASNTIVEETISRGEEWKQNKVEIAPIEQLVIKDFLFTPFVRKNILFKYIKFFVKEIDQFEVIILEIEELFTNLLEVSLMNYVEVHHKKLTQQNTLLDEKNIALSASIEKLRKTEEHLTQLNRDLERKVLERTKELSYHEQELIQLLQKEIDLNKKLVDSENFLSSIIDQSPVSTWISDARGTQVRVNKACLDLFGIDDPQIGIGKYNVLNDPLLLNQPFYDEMASVFHFGKIARFTANYDFSKTGLSTKIESKPLILTINVFPIKNAYGKITHVVIQHEDITEKQFAIDELKRNKDELQLLTDSLPLLISYVDKDQRYRFNNKAYTDWFGAPREENYGKKVYEVIGSDAFKSVKDYIESALNGNQVSYEARMHYVHCGEKYVSASFVPHIEDNEVKGFYSVVMDISHKKKLEEEIKTSKELLDKIFQEAPALIALLDGKEKRYIMANPPCLSLFGNRELLGKTIREANPEFENQDIFENLEDVSINKKVLILKEKLLYIDRENDDNLIPGYYNLVIHPIVNQLNELEAILIFALEVTEEIKGRQKLEVLAKEPAQAYSISERKNQELLRMNQVLDNFVYSAAHDLRAPVSNLKALVNLFSNPNSRLTEEKFLKETQTSLERLNNTITGLVEVIEIQNKSTDIVKEVSFKETLDLILAELTLEIERIDPIIQYDFHKAPSIKYIEVYLNSIIRNLFSNALKYNSEDRPLKIEIKTARNDGSIVLSIKDNGIGMDLEKYGKNLFKPFTRFHKKVEGKGIGLHLIKNMVERNGGFIVVESQIDIGTHFKFYLKEY